MSGDADSRGTGTSRTSPRRDAFAPLCHPIVFERPARLTDVDAWHEHIPFAFFAVAELRPRVLVELGTHKGDSYCAFCQAVGALALPTRCYAVDTWSGDEHSGLYGPEVLEELRAYDEQRHGAFSCLLQETFDDAAARFADGSIDLLHLDGCHRYDAARHDLETWWPKLSDRGVLVLHDTNARERDFGVWRLWEELAPAHPSFAFAHGHGLGVLAPGPRVERRFLDFLREAQEDALAASFFASLGRAIALPARAERLRAASEDAAAQRVQAAEKARAAAERAAERLHEQAERAEVEREALQAEHDRSLHERDELRAERDALRFEAERLAAEVSAREADIEGVVGSASWRLTAPLRAAKGDLRRARRLVHRLRRLRRTGLPRRYAPAWSAEGPDGPGGAAPGGASVAELGLRPLVSILTPVFDTDPRWLRAAVESVRRQSYPHWQLCLADDGSTNAPTLAYLRSLAGDPAITVLFGQANRGIAAATNSALAAATGEFVAFLDHDDELDPDALLECVRRLNDEPETDALYTDEDKIDVHGRRREPFFKPDWSPELFRGVMYAGHLLLVRRSLVESLGGLEPSFDGVQDYELLLRVSERTARIGHVARVLYHWRALPQSIASSPQAKDGISELQSAAVAAHLARVGIAARARPHPHFPHRTVLEPRPRARWPTLCVIIPTRDAPRELGRCLSSIFECSTYPGFRVLLVDNGTTDPRARALFDRYPVEVLPFEQPFNFARANNLAVAHVDSELVVLLNNDTEIETPDWLEQLVGLVERDGVGAVGPLLVYPDRSVQHAGVVLGLRGSADHIMRGFPSDCDGYAGSLSCTREVSAVTGACMALRRDVFSDLGGFDEHFATHYQDVDLCLRLGRSGRRNLYTPRAVVRHAESATRGGRYDHLDRALLLDAWGETIERGDPYYSPWLSLAGADYQPRERAGASAAA